MPAPPHVIFADVDDAARLLYAAIYMPLTAAVMLMPPPDTRSAAVDVFHAAAAMLCHVCCWLFVYATMLVDFSYATLRFDAFERHTRQFSALPRCLC